MNLPFDLSSIYDFGLNAIALIVFFGFILAVLGGVLILIYLFYWRYRQFNIIIWEKDPVGKTIETYDSAGIFMNKKVGIKALWLKKNKVPLDCDRIPFLKTSSGNKVYVLKCGNKSFKYLYPTVCDSGLKFNVGEADLNWGIYEFNLTTDKYQIKNNTTTYIAMAILFIVTFAIVFMVAMLIKKFDVLLPTVQTLERVAKILTGVV